MAGPIDTFLKLCVGISLLGAAGSVGYYYSVYLPSRDAQLDRDRRLEAAHAEYSRQAEQERIAAEKRDAEVRSAAAREASQATYQVCIQNAEANYSGTWATNCKRISEQNAKSNKDCLTQGSTKSYCDTVYGSRDASPSCALPRILGSDLNDQLEKARKRCGWASQTHRQPSQRQQLAAVCDLDVRLRYGVPSERTWCYPLAALGAYREWLQDVYIEGGKFSTYLRGKVTKGEIAPSVAQLAIAALVPALIASPNS
jgi:hypothetical protein